MNLHHIGVAVRSLQRDGAAFCEALGLAPPGPAVEDPVQRVRVAFSGSGPAVEFVEPAAADSPVSDLVDRGGGLYHLCFEVEDLDASLRRLRDQGARLVARPQPAAAFGGRRIAFCGLGGSLVELLEAEPPTR